MLAQRISLLRRSDKQIVEGLLLKMTDKHFQDFDLVWRDVLLQFEEEDKYWDWLFKLRQSLLDKRYESYAIEINGMTQGLMWLETQWHRSWLNPEKCLVYVGAIATDSLESPFYPKSAIFTGCWYCLVNICSTA